jgi:hypothetical protein
VIAALRTPGGRIALAIAVSLFIHAAILWMPYLTLPQTGVQLPPLSVTLEPLPQPVKRHARKLEHAKPVSPKDIARPETGGSARSAEVSMPTMKKTRQTNVIRPFPKHLQLAFTVYDGTHGFRTGEIREQFDISGGRYTLRSERRASGLASLHGGGRIIRISNGKIDAAGLEPDTYQVETLTSAGKQLSRSIFDHASGTIRFQDGSTSALPADTQDGLSFIYQLSQLSLRGEFFLLSVSDVAQLHQYRIEIGAREDIETPMGKLRTLHLRKMHENGEVCFEIWLGLEYRLLPVKFRRIDSSGMATEEYLISSIHAADE